MVKDTAALQAALDRVAVLGGGEVIVSPGVYLIGAVRLGSNTVLRIEDGAEAARAAKDAAILKKNGRRDLTGF